MLSGFGHTNDDRLLVLQGPGSQNAVAVHIRSLAVTVHFIDDSAWFRYSSGLCTAVSFKDPFSARALGARGVR